MLISLPESRCTVEELKPIWETLEEYVRHNKVLSLGVSDLSKSQLEELYNWAEVQLNVTFMTESKSFKSHSAARAILRQVLHNNTSGSQSHTEVTSCK